MQGRERGFFVGMVLYLVLVYSVSKTDTEAWLRPQTWSTQAAALQHLGREADNIGGFPSDPWVRLALKSPAVLCGENRKMPFFGKLHFLFSNFLVTP